MTTAETGVSEDPAAERSRMRKDARTALACLDLTSLNDDDTPLTIERLCARATGSYGTVAAVCVWPRFVKQARSLLPPSIAVAAVANFPDGGSDRGLAVRDTAEIAAAGAQEVDLVLPWRELAMADTLLRAVRRECIGLGLKVILETGELNDPVLIERACRIALDGGADFLKTSTGKTARSATPEAARLMLRAIRDDGAASTRVGFKPAGGIRTVPDAAIYITLFQEMLGAAALSPKRFRIGASSLLTDIEAVLADEPGHAAPAAAADNSY
ncbi:MAG: deoxyribose-phosphate aldolase [Pseudomonadota bacterium]|nr:deoxyribose-phosphate aldolase [Pseudomonadota bacterium]